jgi:hypothetical protein
MKEAHRPDEHLHTICEDLYCEGDADYPNRRVTSTSSFS